jgi:hypothetical protein
VKRSSKIIPTIKPIVTSQTVKETFRKALSSSPR